ncbi:MAG: amino acid--tRNA ligase-related protein [Candidatus Woesebacteria bacterium]
MNRTMVGESVEMVGKTVTLMGWVDTKRDHGKLTFIDLRDRTGIIQSVGFNKMGELSVESVVTITGTVKLRGERYINPATPTGTVEIEVESYEVVNKAGELPIHVQGDGLDINEEHRLKYRYLDMRRERMAKTMRLRSTYSHALRKALIARDFCEIETPILSKATMEGARDFLVPSRFQPGKFYALPQSPQQYKQLLMVAGIERYFQLARCFRDEDLRADRGFEFTQLDLEMSFVERDDVMATVEDVVKESVQAVGGKLQKESFPVYTYKEAMDQFGADKFDLRTEEEKKEGTLAFAWVVDFPMFKKVDKGDAAEVRDSKSGWTFTHNPFSSPKPEHLEWQLHGEHIDEIVTTQYDLICNGYEVGGGSIRAHDPALLAATYKIMGYSEEETQQSVGPMLEAFSYGAPPHGGIGLGLDRLVMLLSQQSSLKEAIPFPMTSTGRTAIMDAPALANAEQLAELGLHVQVASNQVLSPYEKILQKLKNAAVTFEHHEHAAVFTSEEAAKVRGESLHQGSKALVLKADSAYVLYVLPGDLRADFEKIQNHIGAKKLSMASKEDVKEKTGLEVGSIPPFGSAIGLQTYVDPALAENETIFFNPGRHDRTIGMKYADFVQIEKPIVIQ